jgi:hypothetical protein
MPWDKVSRTFRGYPTWQSENDRRQHPQALVEAGANNAHIVAAQTLRLLDILLTAYSPYIPRVGPSRRTEMEAVDTKIRQIVLDVCGMGLSNRQSPPAALTACIAIIICADWFVDVGLGVQKALMEVVVRTTEENNYWPTGESQVRLRQVWGWN